MDRFEWDDKVTGFGQRDRNGKRTWVIQYRLGSQQRRMRIGSAEKLGAAQAREAARKILAKVELGHDPAAEKRDAREGAKHTLRAVAKEYLTAKKSELRNRTYLEHARYLGVDPNDARKPRRELTRYWAPLHSRPVATITRKDVAGQVTRISKDSGATAAARARTVLSSMYAWAVGAGVVEVNPVVGTNVPPEPPPRDRVLSDMELAAVWSAAPDTAYGTIVKMLILTACRREEIGGLRECEIDRDGRMIRLPKERTKNHCAHDIPLSDFAWSILEPALSDQECLFGRDGAAGFKGWPRAKDALVLAGAAPFRLHDLRRTVATRMADLGVLPHIIEAVLNHQGGHKRGVAGIYNKSRYQDGVRAALLLWSSHVQSLVEGQARKIIPIRR
jgi:integrase